ncbi:hypothetical protein CJ030_MR1G015647 [Morella rubra]|uniref:Transmembrane protein n=1 Tax=Morella rubra TaxID=262757 RepID=A0A6A1WNB5_9ROSI|nr:hypothetical protein CJ030_MR1G015647 [Morella rubra]
MLGLASVSHPAVPIRWTPKAKPLPVSPHNNVSFPTSLPKTQSQIPSRRPTSFLVLFAENGNGLLNEDPKESDEEQQGQGIGSGGGGGGGGDDLGKDQRPIFNIRWGDLLDPDPDNLLAIALTGLLAWASAQVLWQLFFISSAIILAALKYSFIAALLLFILITLL